MSKNKANLQKAKEAKNDEHYTTLQTIEAELKRYLGQLEGKKVYLNCDDPKFSNFWNYFKAQFKSIGLESLTATHYVENGNSYKMEILKGSVEEIRTELKGNGDFRSEESIEILKESDVVITNPPFSLFREFIKQLEDHNKDFLVIGSMNALTYIEVFSSVKKGNIRTGYGYAKDFIQPDGSMKSFGNIIWYTTLDKTKDSEELLMFKEYKGNESEYQKHDNYDAIETKTVRLIPEDYEGAMAVPISFMLEHNPSQFELLGIMASTTVTDINLGYPMIKGKKKFARVVIKRK